MSLDNDYFDPYERQKRPEMVDSPPIAPAIETYKREAMPAKMQPVTLRPLIPEPAIATPTIDQGIVSAEILPEPTPIAQPSSLIAREIIETFLLTLLIFWAVNAATGRFRIEGSSMMPTMQEGEYVLINKLAYYLDEPERGDIIVLRYPREPSRDFIKRVIGLPGDQIEVENEQVMINGQLISEPYIESNPRYNGSWTVPEDQFFVLGDNRNNSSDSHTWGFLPRDHIVGKGWLIYWPTDNMERIPHHPHPLNGIVQQDNPVVITPSNQSWNLSDK